ncbi:MAG TPA: TetR/AcrR family transcriptional regulator [Deltaproteobacteria bacterium]|nr:TetR/AcrR family transcriptional regulator [Deltaproteobacteria bacterium]HPJ95540.1 TetR/AcrR family transcriptional regulator [Deltaproteobacteria bacterium]
MTLKERIIYESLRQFSAKGFLSTSITDILDAAGTSKGGFYNHFKSKDHLFLATLSEARKIWREKNLAGVDEIGHPLDKIKKLLQNYRDRYLPDSENLPGGCIFVNLAIELNDQKPELAREVNEGFVRLKAMMKRLLDEEKATGSIRRDIDTAQVTEMIFSGLLGACVMYTSDKSREHLNLTIGALIGHLDAIKN